MSLPQHISYWLSNDKMVAAEIPIDKPDRRAWIGVYPPTRSKKYFKIRYFEIMCSVIDEGYDIAEPELLESQKFTAESEQDVAILLARWLTDLNRLVQPYFCDYPI